MIVLTILRIQLIIFFLGHTMFYYSGLVPFAKIVVRILTSDIILYYIPDIE